MLNNKRQRKITYCSSLDNFSSFNKNLSINNIYSEVYVVFYFYICLFNFLLEDYC